MQKPILNKHAFQSVFFKFIILSLCIFWNVISLPSQTIPNDFGKQILLELDSLFQKRAFQEGVNLVNKTIVKYKANNLENSRDAALVLFWKAKNYRELGDYPGTFPILEQVIKQLDNFQDSVSVLSKAEAYIYRAVGYAQTGFSQKALDNFYKVYETYREIRSENHADVGKSYNNLGSMYLQMGKVDQALEYVQKALKINRAYWGEDPKILSFSYYRLGQIYAEKKQFKLAFEYLQKCLKIRRQVFGENHPRVGLVLSFLASIYRAEEAYERSLTHYQECSEIYKKIYGESHPSVAGIYANIASIYIELGLLEKAHEFASKAAIIFKKSLGNTTNLAETYSRLAVIERLKGNRETALNWHKKEEKINKKVAGGNSLELISTYQNMGALYFHFNQMKQAIFYYEKSQALAIKLLGENHSTVAALKAKTSLSYTSLKDFPKATSLIEESLYTLGFQAENHQNYEQVTSLAILSETLINKANVHDAYYKYTSNVEHLYTTLKSIIEADHLLKFRRTSYKEAASQNRISKEAKALHELGLQVCYQLWQLTEQKEYLQQAFNFIESSKTQQLLTALRTNTQKLAFAGLPDSLLQQLETYAIDLSIYERQLFESDQDSMKTVLKKSIFDLKDKYFQLLEQTEQNYPNYYRLKYTTNLVTIPQVQQLLTDKNTALISYFLGDSTLYSFVITPQSVQWINHRNPKGIKESLLPLIQTLHHTKDSFSTNQSKWQLLSEQLIHEPLSKLPTTINRLVISPDGFLGYIPFEILTINASQNQPIHLLEKHPISYAYSATLLQQQMESQSKANQKLFAGFAPNYKTLAQLDLSDYEHSDVALLVRDGNYHLPGAQSEVAQISALLNGDAFQQEAATEISFKQNAANYQILHLSMHSLFNDQDPLYSKLLFSSQLDTIEDSYLYASELYNMQLNADMVVLSACNTGFGKIQRGEGIMSLSRAFTYAGVPSTVMSLWKVPDKSTSEIMVSFYKYLKAGQTKDAALRQAKLDYLENTIEPDEQHPYYWAGFVAAGDMEAIEMSRTRYSPWLALTGVFLMGLLWWKFR